MINMNSPTVQSIINSAGYNPFVNGQYVPQPQRMPRQNTYSSYNDYNPYIANRQYGYEQDDLYNWENTYDPMPREIVNEARGIHSIMVQPVGSTYNMAYNNGYYNSNVFNGYYNPILMNNIAEQRKITEREESIKQGKIWRSLLGNVKCEDEDFDIDNAVSYIESLYYMEPYQPEMTIKEKVLTEKNRQLAEMESRINYYRENNIPIVTDKDIARAGFYGYYNHLSAVAGDNCDIVDYFTRVYPELKFEQLEFEARKFSKNLKNKYKDGDYGKVLEKVSSDKPDSYYYKLMESFSKNGVKITNGDGLTMTPDQMEIKLPERLLKKRNERNAYYEQRKKFYDSVFRKEE